MIKTFYEVEVLLIDVTVYMRKTVSIFLSAIGSRCILSKLSYFDREKLNTINFRALKKGLYFIRGVV